MTRGRILTTPEQLGIAEGSRVRGKAYGWDEVADSVDFDAATYDPSDEDLEGDLTFNWVESLAYWQFLVDGQLADPETIAGSGSSGSRPPREENDRQSRFTWRDGDVVIHTPMARLYVAGELSTPSELADDEDWPVKIGWTAGRRLDALQVANWREVRLLYEHPLPLATVVGVEFAIHQHLAPWWVRGEWFRVRRHAGEVGGWPQFIDTAIGQEVPGGDRFDLVSTDGGCRLASMHRVAGSHFVVGCSCGYQLDRRGRLPMAVEHFAAEHLKISWKRPTRQRHEERATPPATGPHEAP